MKSGCSPAGANPGGGSPKAGIRARGLAVLDVYLTVKDLLDQEGITYSTVVAGTFTYYFTSEDGSVFHVVAPTSGIASFLYTPYIQFDSGPREGEIEYITWAQVDELTKVAEAKWGKLIKGGSFCKDKFIEGTHRKTIPYFNAYGCQIGYVDAEGPHITVDDAKVDQPCA